MRSSRHRFAPVAIALALTLVACDEDSPADEDATATTATTEADATDTETDTTELPPPDLSVLPQAGEVFAGVTTKTSDLIGGPKAEGIVGDIKLWNNKAAFIVESIRKTGGYRQEGGNVIDIDFASGGHDHFGEVWQAWNFLIFYPDTLDIVSDGRDGVAKVRFTGRTGIYTWANSFIVPVLQPPPADLKVTFEYTLAKDDDVLELVVTLENDGGEDVFVQLPIVAMNMGDGAFNFGIGGGIGGVTGNEQPWVGMIGLERSYGFLGQGKTINGLFNYQNVQLLNEEEYTLTPGQKHEQRYAYLVGDDGTTHIAETASERYGVGTVGTVTGTVSGEVGWEDDEPAPSNTHGRSWVTAFMDSKVQAITPVEDDGTWKMALAPGNYSVVAYAPQRGASGPKTFTVPASLEPTAVGDLALPDLGEVVVTVLDGDDAGIPVEITFFRVAAPLPFSPENAGFDHDWGRERSAVIFSPDGHGRAHLLPGTYTVTASRGWSYEFDQEEITVQPGTSQNVSMVVTKVVDDSGWSAADGHLHSIWSPDSDVPYIARMRQAAANDVELPLFTEHVNVGHAHLEIDQSKVGDWIVAVPAQEVTTFEYGHFNTYPMEYDPNKPSFGAVFEHGYEGAGLFEAIRNAHSHPHITQLNHPRGTAASSYLSYVDFNRDTGSSTNKRWTNEFDVVEVFNGSCSRNEGNQEAMLDWFAMNDHGMNKILGSGSDSHSEASGLGLPRQWIQVSREAVAADYYAMVPPMMARKTFVSCGPFVRFSTSDGKGMGELAKVGDDGSVTFDVKVEAPSWIQLDKLRLLENGVPVDAVTVDLLGKTDVVRFDGTLKATPQADAWYVIEVIGTGNLWPTDPGDVPYALTNVIEIDQDKDDAWTPPAVSKTAPPRPQAPRLPQPTDAEKLDPECKH